MPITMKDIANDLGVSAATVSKVLRNHSDIGEATRQRVLKRVKELNFHPNMMARGLVTGRSYLVGLIVPSLFHPFFAEVAKALSFALGKSGYYLVISSSEENPALEERQINQLLGRGLDAIVVASSCSTPEVFERVRNHGTPFILIDRQFPDFPTNFVGVDDHAVGLLATEHLISVGCRRIAHVHGPNNSPGLGRLAGYREALAKHGLLAIPEYVVSERKVDIDGTQRGAEATRILLALQDRPDGIFCHNDPLAIGVIDTILAAGLRVPEDIAVIGCGNLHYDSSLRVPLSSIDQHTSSIGTRAAKMVLNLITSKTQTRPKSIVLKPEIVVRASTKIRP